MAIESKNLLVAVKAFSRANPLPIDSSSVWDSKLEADTYAKAANAYAGQVVTAKVDDKYKAFILQPSEAGYTLEAIGADPSALKQYVIVGTRPESAQQQGVIYIDNNVGYIWNGSNWVRVFSDFSTDIENAKKRISSLETQIKNKANIASPNFTGSVTIENKPIATQEWVNALVGQLNNGVPGVVSTSSPLPSDNYKAGQMWRVADTGTYAGQKCEPGDLIICLKNYEADSANNSDFMIVQANVDGAVTGPDASTDGHIVIFDGATGKIIKDSNVTIASLNDAISKAHEHANKDKLDTYDKTQTELLNAASANADSKIATAKTELEKVIATKANASDVYTTTDVDKKITTLTQAVNSKVDAATVDQKISNAKTEIGSEVDTKIAERVGEIPEDTDIKTYIDTAVGSGGTTSAEAIAKAKQEAIDTSKAYTDSVITVTEF